MLPSLLPLLLLLMIAIALVWRHLRFRQRQRTLSRLLDLADAVEAILDRTQSRMQALRQLIDRVPADVGEQALTSLESALPIRDAKRDLLQHRLWIQKEGTRANQQALDDACAALDRVVLRLSAQLNALDSAGTDLAVATDAATEAARREPANLRRTSDH